MEWLAGLALSNLLLSAILAVVAWTVHRDGRFPGLAHGLWLLTLVKTVTPPLLVLPVIPAPAPSMAAAAAAAGASLPDWLTTLAMLVLPVGWLTGSAIVLVYSLLRVRRFDALIRRSSTEAPPEVQRLGRALADRLGLPSPPAVLVSAASVSPLTWWTGGRVRIVLPGDLLERLGPQQVRWVLAHELAHVRRRDHLVRWLEWLACVACWWNPVVWWAGRRLREDEEVGCDALVLRCLGGEPRAYGASLLAVLELLALRQTPAPRMATGFDDARALERRLRSIVSPQRRRTAPRLLTGSLATASVLLLVVGLGGTAQPSAPPPGAEGAATVGPPAGDSAGATGGRSADIDADPADDATVDAVGGTPFAFLGGTLPNASDPGSRAAQDAPAGARPGSMLLGTSGADQLTGTRWVDLIVGRGGADEISGGRGDDVIRPGGGRDVIDAGSGDDVVVSWRDGRPDVVDCGAGSGDRVVADRSDRLIGCEIVILRDATSA